jgi:GNAT superfamily N-acetyltransferase
MVKVVDKSKMLSFLKKSELENYAMISIINNEPQCSIFTDDNENPTGVIVKDDHFSYIYYAEKAFLDKLDQCDFCNQHQSFAAVSEVVYTELKKKYKLQWVSKSFVYYLPKECISDKDSGTLDKIHIKDAEKINEYYTYKEQEGLSYIINSIEERPSSALYANDALISSAMVHNNNSIGMLYTSKEYRNRGYGKKVTLDLCRKLVSEDITPIAYITEENTPAIKLFQGCGFRELGTAYWFGILNVKYS